MAKFKLIQSVAFAFALSAVVASASESRTYTLDGEYGAVSYVGTVTRVEQGENYLYEIEVLDLTFNPAPAYAATKQIASPSLSLATTHFVGPDKPYEVSFETSVPTNVHLDAANLKASLRNLGFTVPKTKVVNASYAGLSLVDGRLLWPIHGDLRD